MIQMEEIKHLATLARLSLSPEALGALAKELDDIIAYIGQIESLTLSSNTSPATPTLRNVFRNDENPAAQGEYTEVLTKAFPEREGDLLSVKQIITHE